MGSKTVFHWNPPVLNWWRRLTQADLLWLCDVLGTHTSYQTWCFSCCLEYRWRWSTSSGESVLSTASEPFLVGSCGCCPFLMLFEHLVVAACDSEKRTNSYSLDRREWAAGRAWEISQLDWQQCCCRIIGDERDWPVDVAVWCKWRLLCTDRCPLC